MRRYSKQSILYAILSFALSVLLFQNCTTAKSPVSFNSLTSSSTSDTIPTDSGGHGGTYDGKPSPGTYVRRSVSTCSAMTDVIGIVDVDSMAATLTNDLCAALDYILEFADSRLEFSGYNPDFIGLNAAIFERTEANTVQSRGPSVDLWCRHQDANFGLDFVVKTDPTNSMSNATIYVGENLSSQQPSARKLTPISVTKSTSAGRLRTSSGDGSLTSEIDVSNPDAIKHPGQASVQLDGRNLQLSVSCRVQDSKPALIVAPSNAVAILQMDQALGTAADRTKIADSSRNNYDFALNNQNQTGAQFVSGLIGNALAFDGVDDNIDLTSMVQAHNFGDLTFSAWVQPSLNIPEGRLIFGIFDMVSAAPAVWNSWRIGLGFCSTTGDRGNLQIGTLGGSSCHDSGISILDGNWHMVTGTISGTQMSLYLDGALVGTYPFTATRYATDYWALGQDWDDVNNANDRYMGLMDDVMLWNSSLSGSEIAEMYRKSRP